MEKEKILAPSIKIETLFRKFAIEKTETAFREFEKEIPFTLPWSHYLLLMRIKNPEERRFYESESAEYDLYLPDKKELQKKLRQWIEEETGQELQ